MTDIDDIRRRMERAAEEAVTAVANDLMGRAVADAPIQEGTLRGSARVDVDTTPGGVEATVSFNTPYAASVHEGFATQHRNGKTVEWVMRRNPGGGGPKFLERNLLEQAGRYEKILAEAVRQELERP
jgi:hypothetical protein